MEITIDSLESGDVIALLEEHLRDMYATSPPESVHALDVDALKADNITFFAARDEGTLLGCVAIKSLDELHFELKSMRTTHAVRGQGIGKQLLAHVIVHAQQKSAQRISLETGTQDYFIPACKLYESFGFEYCAPFSDYKLDPNSHFMTKKI